MEIASSRKFAEWLQDHFLEQLSEFSSHIYKLLLVNGEMLVREHVDLFDSILQILTLTAKLSQKRNIYQPHFSLSFDGLFQIYSLISRIDSGCGSTAELGLKAILMSTPPVAVSQTVFPFIFVIVNICTSLCVQVFIVALNNFSKIFCFLEAGQVIRVLYLGNFHSGFRRQQTKSSTFDV